MASPMMLFIRRLILIGNGLVFLLIAIAILFYIKPAAALYGYSLNGIDGFNEFRAVYMGFWVGLAIISFVAAKRLELSILGDLALLLVLLQSLGRFLSFALDGIPHERFVIVTFMEFVPSLIGLLIRPQSSA